MRFARFDIHKVYLCVQSFLCEKTPRRLLNKNPIGKPEFGDSLGESVEFCLVVVFCGLKTYFVYVEKRKSRYKAKEPLFERESTNEVLPK